MKLSKSRKGFNDVTLIGTIVMIFIAVGASLPFVNAEFGDSSTDFNTEDLQTDLNDQITDVTSVSTTTVLFSIGKMFFWTFGSLPLFLELFFTVFRILLALLLYRQIRSGAG